MLTKIRERVVRVTGYPAAADVVAFSRSRGRRCRLAVDSGRIAVLVTADRDFAWLCEHVVADQTPAPRVFRVAA